MVTPALGHTASIWGGFDDPLLVNPPILASGAVLPDGSRVSCPVQLDLSQALGVSEVIDMALCSNPRVKQAWANIKVQSGAVGEAKSAYLPKVQSSISTQQFKEDFPQDSSSNIKTRRDIFNSNLTWRLFDFGGRAATKASADHLLYAALQTYDADIQQTLQRVIQSYFDVLASDASLKAKKEAVVYAKSSLEATLRKEARGASAKNESLQAQAALARVATRYGVQRPSTIPQQSSDTGAGDSKQYRL
jgi:outer membrane protein